MTSTSDATVETSEEDLAALLDDAGVTDDMDDTFNDTDDELSDKPTQVIRSSGVNVELMKDIMRWFGVLLGLLDLLRLLLDRWFVDMHSGDRDQHQEFIGSHVDGFANATKQYTDRVSDSLNMDALWLNEAFLPVFFFVISVLLHAPNSDTLKTVLAKTAVCYVGLPFTCSFVQDVCLGARDLAEHEKTLLKKEFLSKIRKRFLFHPRLAWSWLVRVRLCIRWIRWLLPLYGALMKLRKTVTGIIRMKASNLKRRRRRHQRLKNKTVEQKTLFYTLQLQAIFRRKKARQKAEIGKERGNGEKYSAKGADETMAKAETLHALFHSKDLGDHKREEARALDTFEFDEKNVILLLRPGSRFMRLYRHAFLIMVMLEGLRAVSRGSDTQPLTYLELMWLGVSHCVPEDPAPPRGLKLWRTKYHIPTAPEWCDSYGYVVLIMFRTSVAYCLRNFVYLMKFVEFPLTLFTGVVDEQTGALKPKPLTSTVPFCLLMIFVSPCMKAVTSIVSVVLGWILENDPCRILRITWWCAPLLQLVLRGLKARAWRLYHQHPNWFHH